MNDNRRIAEMLRAAAVHVESMTEDMWVHTVTVTLDGRSQRGVTATIAWQEAADDYLEDGEPVILT